MDRRNSPRHRAAVLTRYGARQTAISSMFNEGSPHHDQG
ncbi:MAG: hypothetical protein AVDCRST_MAG43-1268 [uncultured Thermomicrobiales bacterium]|uniref:Uncharacterized protein n=1 Tax=uncultured Thermomicrobiales bacterium TaxID=1645740 RepID=A0A6J4UQD8_9BACT|nr:MAG: hypothetical protein AVDCRST_MAG43-1268 [uncultured Thermomicrobiales bacterium]